METDQRVAREVIARHQKLVRDDPTGAGHPDGVQCVNHASDSVFARHAPFSSRSAIERR